MAPLGPLLVGVDGSPGSVAALRWAAWLADRTGAEVRVGYCWEHGRLVEPLRSAVLDSADEERLEADVGARLWEIVDAELGPGSPVTECLALRGEAAASLGAWAGRHDGSLVVVGARGAGGALRVVLGSVCRRLTEHPAQAVAVVPDALVLPEPDGWSVVVGTDGSTGASRALRWAAATAAGGGGRLVVVHVVEPPVPDLSSRERAAVDDEMRARLEEEWCAPLRASGVPYEAVVEHGPVALAVGRTADAVRPACVVVGSRGLGGWSRQVLGSVTHRLIRDLAWPTVVIPGPRDAVVWRA